VVGNVGALAGLASLGPSAAVFLNSWPHVALRDELSRSLDSWVTANEGNDVPNGREEKGRKVVVFLQSCRIRV
jgi:hypothetical protein